jgi:hypothetical protein
MLAFTDVMQHQRRRFYPGPWAPALAMLAACVIAGSVFGTAYVAQELPSAADATQAAAGSALHRSSQGLMAAAR